MDAWAPWLKVGLAVLGGLVLLVNGGLLWLLLGPGPKERRR